MVINLRGEAVIQVRNDSEGFEELAFNPTFSLNISDSAGRLGRVAFKSDAVLPSLHLKRHLVSGLSWTVVGSGLLVHKPIQGFGLTEGDLYGVAAVWPVTTRGAKTFRRVGEENALESVRSEPGCLAFGVFESLKQPAVFSLVEVFDSINGFRSHLETEHFRKFVSFARPQYLGDPAQTLKGSARWL